MAATLISRIADVASNFKAKAIAVSAIVLAPGGAARGDVTTFPTVSAGAGLPSVAAPNGSLYLQTDGTDGTDSIHMRIAGSWVALAG